MALRLLVIFLALGHGDDGDDGDSEDDNES